MLGERFIEPFPRGFKRFFGAGVGLPFPARLQLIEQQTGGRVTFRMPADAGENWYDRAGVPHHPPTPPVNLQHLFSLLFEVQLNSSRLFVTSHR